MNTNSMLSNADERRGQFDALRARIAAWRDAGSPMTPAQRRHAEDYLERAAVEVGGPIPARFAPLQYLNH